VEAAEDGDDVLGHRGVDQQLAVWGRPSKPWKVTVR
jgi:hypothetical protein